MQYSQDHTPRLVINKWEENYNCRGSLQGARRPRPTLGSLGPLSWTRKTGPQNVWLWRSVGITFGRARGLWQTETPLLKDAHKISHVLGPRAEAVIWKEPGSDPLANLRELPKRHEATGAQPGDTDTGSSQSGSSFYHKDTDADRYHFGILLLAY